MTRLVVVSHTPHYTRHGELVGWGPTVREIDQLARLFDEVVHVAPVHDEPAPASALPYASPRVRIAPVAPAGGERVADKVAILARLPSWIRVIARELKEADVAHVRCPANISMAALAVLAVASRPRMRWVKYAGSWAPRDGEPLSYIAQRWWLRRRLHRGVVTVNGEWAKQPAHVHSFLNPCLTEREVEEGHAAAVDKRLEGCVRLLSVGRLERAKGVEVVLRTVAELRGRGVPVLLDLAGDGPERSYFEDLARELGIAGQVRFHGWLSRPSLGSLYGQAHLLLLPSSSEGWPKVLSEGMAYGVVPLASAVGSVPGYLAHFRVGRVLGASDAMSWADAVSSYVREPARWQEESGRALEGAPFFTYDRYLDRVRELLGSPVGNPSDSIAG